MGLGTKLSRLSRMSGDELLTRVRQELGKRADVLQTRLGSPIEVSVGPPTETKTSFFFRPSEVAAIAKAVAARDPQGVAELIAQADKICAHRFSLLGYEDLD